MDKKGRNEGDDADRHREGFRLMRLPSAQRWESNQAPIIQEHHPPWDFCKVLMRLLQAHIPFLTGTNAVEALSFSETLIATHGMSQCHSGVERRCKASNGSSSSWRTSVRTQRCCYRAHGCILIVVIPFRRVGSKIQSNGDLVEHIRDPKPLDQ
jgi:hypothetical protein